MPTTTVRPPKPAIDYPRPPVVREHAKLFVEASYQDGEPYAQDDEDEEPAIITA